MKLRNADLAVIERHKILDYLLNSAHPDNGGKAQFFESLGFFSDAPEPLIAALGAVARTGEVVDSSESLHGEKHVVDGLLWSQTGSSHSRMVRTVWIIDRGVEAPRLVTAYPGKE